MAKFQSTVDPAMETRILHELEPVVENVYDRHMTTGPRRGQIAGEEPQVGTFSPLKELYKASGLPVEETLTPELVESVQSSFSPHAQQLELQGLDFVVPLSKALHMNLGTEDNITWYHTSMYPVLKQSPAFDALLRRWTLEETGHGPLIEYWMMMAGVGKESIANIVKAHQITGGIGVDTRSFVTINAYTDPQEADTVDAHRNVSLVADPVGKAVMNLLVGHEARHNRAFRAIGEALYQLDQEIIDYALPLEFTSQRDFAMPAEESYPDFHAIAKMLAVHGFFPLESVVERQKERIDALGLLDLHVTTEEAKLAQEGLAEVIDINSRKNKFLLKKIEKQKEQYIAEQKAKGNIPFILGTTVTVEKDDSNKHVVVVHPEAA